MVRVRVRARVRVLLHVAHLTAACMLCCTPIIIIIITHTHAGYAAAACICMLYCSSCKQHRTCMHTAL